MQELSLVPTDQRALAVRQILETEGVEAAETALMLLADAQGDAALATLVTEMRPIDLNHLVRSFDFTKPTIAMEFLAPEKAAEMLKTEVRFFEQKERAEIQRSVVDLLYSLVFSGEEEDRQSKMLEAIGATPWGLILLEICFADRGETFWFFKTGSFHLGDTEPMTGAAVPKGDWQELLFACKEHQPELFNRIAEDLTAFDEDISNWLENGNAKFSEAEDLFLEAFHEGSAFVPTLISNLREASYQEEDEESDSQKSDDLFKPL